MADGNDYVTSLNLVSFIQRIMKLQMGAAGRVRAQMFNPQLRYKGVDADVAATVAVYSLNKLTSGISGNIYL